MSTHNISAQSSNEVVPITGRNWLYILSLLLVVIGIGISSYLSYVKLTDVPMQCIQGSVFNCEVVQSSIYARLFGIPVAWLGLATYLIIGALLLLQDRFVLLRNYGIMIQFGIILFAFLFSMWLVYVQFFRLEALCMWCLAHEVNMTVLFIVTIPRLVRSLA
jgi:uncharacterized membrane protein